MSKLSSLAELKIGLDSALLNFRFCSIEPIQCEKLFGTLAVPNTLCPRRMLDDKKLKPPNRLQDWLKKRHFKCVCWSHLMVGIWQPSPSFSAPRSRVEKHCVDCFHQPACCQIIELCDLVRGVWRQSHYLGDNNQRFTYPVKLVGVVVATQYTCDNMNFLYEATCCVHSFKG